MEDEKTILLHSINILEKWIVDNKYKGYEPFDGLTSYLKPLTFNSLLFERILQQTVRQSPINLRPAFGVKKKDSTKGRGYMAKGYISMYQLTRKEIYKEKAVNCLDWLIKNKSPMYENYSWGNHFEYVSRGGRLPLYEPTIVWTSLIGQAFLDGFQAFHNNKYLDVAMSACNWILNLSREKTDRGDCLSYVAFSQRSIHNSNMLGSALLARTGNIVGNDTFISIANKAMEYSCKRQRNDGSWYYGEEDKYHWVDNFHTGYNLDSLKCYMEFTNDQDFNSNLEKGLEYYVNNFFENDGTPKYYNNRKYPIDIQCASQAITTLSYFSENRRECIDVALKVALWTIKNMQDPEGYFYYRIYPLIKSKAPMIHWGQATMYRGLSSVLLKTNILQPLQ